LLLLGLSGAFSLDLVDRSGSKRAPKSDLGRSWGDFGSPRGSISVFFRCFSARAFRLARRRRDIRKTYKTMCFTCFSHVRACAHNAKFDRKSLRTRFSMESRDRSRSKGALFEFLSFKMALEGSPGRLGRPPGAILGSSWALLGRSWSALGRSWASKFSRFFQKCLKKLQICCLRGSWAALGSPPGDQSSIFDPPRVDFDPPRLHFGPPGYDLEAFRS